MTRKEFEQAVSTAVQTYIDNFDRFEPNPQVRVDPVNLYVEPVSGNDFYEDIEDSDEAVENAAHAEGMATETADDFQVSENPDFYAIKDLVEKKDGKVVPNVRAITALAAKYF